jgi:hypothetical protein
MSGGEFYGSEQSKLLKIALKAAQGKSDSSSQQLPG